MKLPLIAAVAALPLLASSLRAEDGDLHYRTNGYSILYKLCEQERPLDLILMVKTTPKKIADYLHSVSASAKEDVAWMDQLQAHDKSLKYNERGLPPLEEDTRTAIEADKQHMLLFGSKDSAFVRVVLITQIDAGTYGMNVAKVLADAEPNTHRASVIRKIGSRWEKIRDRAYALLNAI